jgi:hypothetical protein
MIQAIKHDSGGKVSARLGSPDLPGFSHPESIGPTPKDDPMEEGPEPQEWVEKVAE